MSVSSPVDIKLAHCMGSLRWYLLDLNGFDVVGRQHAGLSGTLHGAVHPTLIDGLHIYDDITILEGHLIIVSSGIVVHGTDGFLFKVK